MDYKKNIVFKYNIMDFLLTNDIGIINEEICDEEKCRREHILYMENINNPYDKVRVNLQALAIRDQFYNNLIKDIFIKKFKFDFEYSKIKLNNKTMDLGGTNLDNLNNFITNIKSNGLYFLDISETFGSEKPGHANVHIIIHDNNGKYVYIYEPHQKKYKRIESYINFYKNLGYNIKDLPQNILTQESLPLCYMYVLHFFLTIYFIYKNKKDINKYIQTSKCDDLYIMTFTKQILKLIFMYGYIDEIKYYVLTNNTFEIIKKINENIQIDTIFGYINSDSMIKIIKNNISSKMHIDSVFFLYDLVIINIFKYYYDAFSKENFMFITKDLLSDSRIKPHIKILFSLITDGKFPKESEIKKILELEKIYNIDYVDIDDDNRSLLILATKKNLKNIVKILLENGANIKLKDESGKTAIDYADMNGNKEISILLNEYLYKR